MTTSTHRKCILRELELAWEKHPNLRLGQLIIQAANPIEVATEIFYMEDNELVRALRRLR